MKKVDIEKSSRTTATTSNTVKHHERVIVSCMWSNLYSTFIQLLNTWVGLKSIVFNGITTNTTTNRDELE